MKKAITYYIGSQCLLKNCLWVDHVDALKYLQDKQLRKLFNEEQAFLIKQFIEQGYCIIPDAIPSRIIERAWADLESAYADKIELTCHKEGFGTFSSEQAGQLPGMDNRRYAVHDFHTISDATLDVATHSTHSSIVKAILGVPPILMQSQMFLFGSGKGAHCDFPYYPLNKPLQTVTVFIAGAAMLESASPLYYYPGSHHLPVYEFSDGNVLWCGGEDMNQMRKYNFDLMKICENHELERRLFLGNTGSVLIFNSRLIHGSLPALNPQITRRSFALHYSTPSVYTFDHKNSTGNSRLCVRANTYYYRRSI